MRRKILDSSYVVCVSNKGYKASLIARKIYQVIPDNEARKKRLLRVIDESGEDYLFPQRLFAAIELPKSIEKKFSVAT